MPKKESQASATLTPKGKSVPTPGPSSKITLEKFGSGVLTPHRLPSTSRNKSLGGSSSSQNQMKPMPSGATASKLTGYSPRPSTPKPKNVTKLYSQEQVKPKPKPFPGRGSASPLGHAIPKLPKPAARPMTPSTNSLQDKVLTPITDRISSQIPEKKMGLKLESPSQSSMADQVEQAVSEIMREMMSKTNAFIPLISKGEMKEKSTIVTGLPPRPPNSGRKPQPQPVSRPSFQFPKMAGSQARPLTPSLKSELSSRPSPKIQTLMKPKPSVPWIPPRPPIPKAKPEPKPGSSAKTSSPAIPQPPSQRRKLPSINSMMSRGFELDILGPRNRNHPWHVRTSDETGGTQAKAHGCLQERPSTAAAAAGTGIAEPQPQAQSRRTRNSGRIGTLRFPTKATIAKTGYYVRWNGVVYPLPKHLYPPQLSDDEDEPIKPRLYILGTNMYLTPDTLELFIGRIRSFAMLKEQVELRCQKEPELYSLDLLPADVKTYAESVQRLEIMRHNVSAFRGMKAFSALKEVRVSHTDIVDSDMSEYVGNEPLERMYFHRCLLKTMFLPAFQHLKILGLARNNLHSLDFLRAGFPSLTVLNVAKNDICYITEAQLMKIPNVVEFNLTGNPLCTIQDILALRTMRRLRNLLLSDEAYASCPVAQLCEGRSMIITLLPQINLLDEHVISPVEVTKTEDLMNGRSIYYYASVVKSISKQVKKRKKAMDKVSKAVEKFRHNIYAIVVITTQLSRVIKRIYLDPTNMTGALADNLVKLKRRQSLLEQKVERYLKRVDIRSQISRWEEEIMRWIKWIELKSFLNIQASIVHSVHGPKLQDSNSLMQSIHQLISSLSCINLWPKQRLVKVETIVVMNDKGLETGMDRIHYYQTTKKVRRPYVPPGKEFDDFIIFGKRGAKKPKTYLPPGFKPPTPLHDFPESVPGLHDSPPSLFLFVIPPPNINAVTHVHRLMTSKSLSYKSIKLTNCLWAAHQFNGDDDFAAVVIVKVLPEFLVTIPNRLENSSKHAMDCGIYGLNRPLAFAPAYILCLSFTPNHKDKLSASERVLRNEEEMCSRALCVLESATNKYGFEEFPLKHFQGSAYLRQTADEFEADLSSLQVNVNEDGQIITKDSMRTQFKYGFEVKNISKLLEPSIPSQLTSLNLSGNRVALVIGLPELPLLKKLDLSHNHLVTLGGLRSLPLLTELKIGWNSIRFFLSSVNTLAESAPGLLTLDVLPNIFKDLKDVNHIPIILKEKFNSLTRVDYWTFPIKDDGKKQGPPAINTEAEGFSTVKVNAVWGKPIYSFSHSCLRELNKIPENITFPKEFDKRLGVGLDLSDNYLTSESLARAEFMSSKDWQKCLLRLYLQSNQIENLNWVKGIVFERVFLLNLSNNGLSDLSEIPLSFPSLKYLHLCQNFLEGTTSKVLAPLKSLKNLTSLQCSGSPLSKNKGYGLYVLKFLPSVELLDGKAISDWEINSSVRRLEGTFTNDWITTRVTKRKKKCPSKILSLPHVNIRELDLPGAALPDLLSVNLSHNRLTQFGSLMDLPGLRTLCVSHNCISELGRRPEDYCPQCSNLAYITAERLEEMTRLQGTRLLKRAQYLDRMAARLTDAKKIDEDAILLPYKDKKKVFPRLQVLIMAHNGLPGVRDLHLHAMPFLKTAILNCNKIACVDGFEAMPCMTVLVLDCNDIVSLPRNAFEGCKNLKYLHLDHNRLSSIPRLPHLTNLKSLFLAHNKISKIENLGCLNGSAIRSLTLAGNPICNRDGYRASVAIQAPKLKMLDSKALDLKEELDQEDRFISDSDSDLETFNNGYNNSDTPSPFEVEREKEEPDMDASSSFSSNMSTPRQGYNEPKH